MAINGYEFDRFLRYDEMVAWLNAIAAKYPNLVSIESYGKSHLGRDLLLATITDTTTGAHNTKPAHWIDANIHAVEVTGGVAALFIIQDLVEKFSNRDEVVVEALRTRTFYIATSRRTSFEAWLLTDTSLIGSCDTTRWWRG